MKLQLLRKIMQIFYELQTYKLNKNNLGNNLKSHGTLIHPRDLFVGHLLATLFAISTFPAQASFFTYGSREEFKIVK